MKILYFHQHFSTPKGVTGTRSYEFARRLVARGHEVTMVCGSSAVGDTGLSGEPVRGIRRGNVDGIDVIEIAIAYSNYDGLVKRSLVFLKFALRSIGIAWREKYDLLFATSTPLTASIPGIAMRLLRPKRKFVFEVRDLWPDLPRKMGVIKNRFVLAAMSMLEKASYRAMHAGVALSPGIEKGMRRRTRAAKPIAMVPNGCDLNLFGSTDDEDTLPAGIPRDGLRCLFAGAHGVANGLDAVLDAAQVLQSRGRSDIHLIFMGDGKLKPALQQRAQEQNLPNCLFLDPLPKLQFAPVMRAMDVGMMILANVPAFYYGTSPNKFFDYLAAELPVLNNYPGWIADLIQENECGVVVPPDEPEAFADALCWMADHADELPKVGQRARALAETDFDRTLLADRWVDFLERQVPGSATPATTPAPTQVRDRVLDDVVEEKVSV